MNWKLTNKVLEWIIMIGIFALWIVTFIIHKQIIALSVTIGYALYLIYIGLRED